ncbi:MAG: intermembrane transport protein PqiB [Coraliomargarita sp.]
MTANKPTLDKRKRLPVIWFIPILALVLGVWMVVNAKLSEGPHITIQFDTADGITAEKTKVRYLNVEIGMVKEIMLTEDKKKVLLGVELVPEAAYMLRDDTEFWVVRARVGAGSVSGLETLLGGAYIELSPGEGAVGKFDYIGLETPPLSPVGAPGVKLKLFADKAGSISTGDAVLYNGYKVGVVEGMSFDESKKMVRYDLFVDAPFDSLVTSTTRFWNISGIQMNASASGIEVQTGSMDTILFGGVSFGSPEGVQPGKAVRNGAEFRLFDNYSAVQEQPYASQRDYVMEFDESVRGLLPGAPVEFRGIEVGYVKRVMIEETMARMAREDERNAPIPVLITIEPGRLGMSDTEESLNLVHRNILAGVKEGMRGSLETGNLITGSLYINIDYRDNLSPQDAGEYEGYVSIPTAPTGLKRIEQQVSSLLGTLNALPFEGTLERIDGTMLALTETLNSIDSVVKGADRQEIPAEISKTLAEMRSVLSGLSSDSPLYQDVQASISKLFDVLYHIDQVSRTLKNQPNSLIFNPKLPDDPVLEAPIQ